MAFYWVRWLPHGGQTVPVFLPGSKQERLVDLLIAAVPSSGGTVWQAPLRHAALKEKPPVSVATAQISPDRHLLRLAFEVHGSHCDGKPVVPADTRQ